MTIGIGVLAPLYATCADQVDRAAEFLPVIATLIRAEKGKGVVLSYGDYMRIIARAASDYKLQRFAMQMGSRYPIPTELLAKQWITLSDADLRQQIQKDYESFDIGCDIIIVAFDGATDQAFLFQLEGHGYLYNYTFPGFAAIGTGAGNAMFWLSYRNHHLGQSILRSAYEAYEAKLMAELAEGVNEDIQIIVANKKENFELHQAAGKNEIKDCPISLKQLKLQFQKYGPRKTDALDKVTPTLSSLSSPNEP